MTDRIITEEKKTKRQRSIILLLIAILLLLLLLLLVQCQGQDGAEEGPSRTAVIQNVENEPLNETETGSIRIVINPVVQVLEDTMQNLGFCNYNKDRLLQCKIKVDETYIYDSGLLPEGRELLGDFVDTAKLKKGENQALAEIYSYDMEKNPIGQTNVKIKLNVE